jgi:hypothetical protein
VWLTASASRGRTSLTCLAMLFALGVSRSFPLPLINTYPGHFGELGPLQFPQNALDRLQINGAANHRSVHGLRLTARESGKREATLKFDAGQGTQDLGFRAEVPLLFRVAPR